MTQSVPDTDQLLSELDYYNPLSDFTDYEYALYSVIQEGPDYAAQIWAARELLKRQKEADRLLEDKIKEADDFARRTTGILNQQAIDDYIYHVHEATYQDAAHSMAALGMLAPLIESLFVQSFAGMRRILATSTAPRSASHPRWYWPTNKQWDCHYYSDGDKPKKGLPNGILELATAIGLSARLPDDLGPMLEALFEYRNAMFHCGFEWPPVERQKFDKKRAKWPRDWFGVSTSGNQPWIFYLTDTFIDRCFTVRSSLIVAARASNAVQWFRLQV